MKNWRKIMVLAALTFCALGCTMQVDMQAHYPGKHNAIDTYTTRPATTQYKGSYRPPFPVAPPAAEDPKWWHGADLGLRND